MSAPAGLLLEHPFRRFNADTLLIGLRPFWNAPCQTNSDQTLTPLASPPLLLPIRFAVAERSAKFVA
jgi:hypothetical protein